MTSILLPRAVPGPVRGNFRAVHSASEFPTIDPLAVEFPTGDQHVLRQVYDRHGAAIHTFCARTVGDAAADVTQEVFVAAWTNRHRYDSARGPLVAWLYGIARFKVLDHLRKSKRVPSPFDDVPEGSGDEDAVEAIAQQLVIRAALDELPPQRKQLVELAFFSDLTHNEISQRTGIPIGSVKSDIRRGLLRLRDILEAHDAERT